jgi:hypothetical protein
LGTRRVPLARLSDRCEDPLEVAEDLAVREANHSVPLSLQGSSPVSVVFDLIRLLVRIPINFDAQPGVGAVEIGDVTAQENVLPADVESNLVITEPTPEFLLGRSERVAQVAGLAQD